MAKFNVVGLDDLQERMLQKAQIAEEAVPEMLKAGGAVMQEAQKAEIRKMFRSRTERIGTGYATRQKAWSCNTGERICQRARGSRRRTQRRLTL